MENELVAEVVLSGALPEGPEGEALVRPIAEEAVAQVLGAKSEGAVSQLVVRGERIAITLTSTGARPHQALLSFVKRLQDRLGRSHRVGIRSLRALHYTVRFPLDPVPAQPIGLPIPHEIWYEGTTAVLTLSELDEEALRDNWIDRAVALVEEKARRQAYQGKEQYWALLKPAVVRPGSFREDPTEAMIRRGWVRNGPTKGKWFLGPRAAHVLRAMERLARREVLEPLGFSEVVQPHHDSFDILLRTGHLAGLPGEFYYVAEPRTRDPGAWERFTDLVKITRQVPTEELAKLVGPPSAVSCYAQCPTVYWWLSGRTIAEGSLPLKVYDRTAISNRYESGGRHGLERVDEFHRIEPVYLGTPEQLLALREELLARYTQVFDNVLELEWRTAWVTPFYLQQSGGVGVEDATERIQGTIDFEAYLPYRGSREESEWLEFQNLSIVGDKYTKAFTIRPQKGLLWSGCSGIGLERWTTAFLAQKGLDPEGWPSRFREIAGPPPPDPTFL